MPTEQEKRAEKERVTRISGFRVGMHDFLAEVDPDALKRRNDHGRPTITASPFLTERPKS
jgi:hypothetical protein